MCLLENNIDRECEDRIQMNEDRAQCRVLINTECR
jgi:hypothetical protein